MNKKTLLVTGLLALGLTGIGAGAAMASTPAPTPAPSTSSSTPAEVAEAPGAAEAPGVSDGPGGHADTNGVDVNHLGGASVL